MVEIFLAILLLLFATLWQNVSEAKKRREEKRASRALAVDDVDKMSGHEFERYVGFLLEEAGFEVEETPGSGDRGADLIVRGNGRRFLVQTKRWKNSVGPGVVRETVGAQHSSATHYDGCMVVTNSTFTDGAREAANGNHCKLVGRSELATWIEDFRTDR